jgi:hypothetical protein
VAAVVIMPNTDLALARTLLGGYTATSKSGLPENRYLNEAEEREGRKALANILRDTTPLDRDLRYLLAALFSPEGAHKEEHADPHRVERKLVFKFRSRKRRTDSERNTFIVQDVYNRIKLRKQRVDEAIAGAADQFGLSEESVRALWKRYKWARDQKLFD